MTTLRSSSTLSTLAGFSTLVGDLLVADTHAHFVDDTAKYGILAPLDLSEEHDGERSPELGAKDVAPTDCRQLGGVAQKYDMPTTPRTVGNVDFGEMSTEEPSAVRKR